MADLEELDYGYDEEEERDASLLADKPVQEQNEDLEDYQDEEEVSIQPQRSASSIHSRLSGKPKISTEQDFEEDENEEDCEVGEDYQEDVGSQEEMGGDEEECHEIGEEKGEEEEDGDDGEDDSRRSRFKTERSVDSSKISLTSAKKDRIIPESLDEIIKEKKLDLKVEQRQNRGRGRGGQVRGGQGRGGRGMAPGRPGLQGRGPVNPKDFFNQNQGPMPPRGIQGQQRGHIPSLMGIPTGGLLGTYPSYQQNHDSYRQNYGSYPQSQAQMAMRSQIQAASSLIDRMSSNLRSQVNGQSHGIGCPMNYHNNGMRDPMPNQNYGMRDQMNNARMGGQQQQYNQNSNRSMQQYDQYSQRSMHSGPQPLMGQSAGAHNYLKSLSSSLSRDNSASSSTMIKDLDNNDLRNTLASGRDMRNRLGGIVKNNQSTHSKPGQPGNQQGKTNVLSRLGGVVGPAGKQQGKPDLRNSTGTGSNILSRLGGIVNTNNKQQGGGGPGNQNEDLRGLLSRGQTGRQTGAASLAKGITPARKIITPARKAITPPGKGIAPAGKGIAPAGKGIALAGKGIAPAGKVIAPAGKVIAPAGKVIAPASKGIAPAGKGKGPAGKVITSGKATTTTVTQPANSLKRTHTDPPSNDKIKVARDSGGSNAISILQQICIVPIKYFEKSIGTHLSPEFECNAVFNGQKFRGVGKQKKTAKHAAAEASLRSIMQNWVAGKSNGINADVLKSLVDKDLQQQQQ